MTRRDLSREPDDALDELILAARADLDTSLEHELREFGPDFAAVVEAAHARDPQKISHAALAEALALAPVVVLGAESSQRMSVRASAELGQLGGHGEGGGALPDGLATREALGDAAAGTDGEQAHEPEPPHSQISHGLRAPLGPATAAGLSVMPDPGGADQKKAPRRSISASSTSVCSSARTGAAPSCAGSLTAQRAVVSQQSTGARAARASCAEEGEAWSPRMTVGAGAIPARASAARMRSGRATVRKRPQRRAASSAREQRGCAGAEAPAMRLGRRRTPGGRPGGSGPPGVSRSR